MSLGDYFDASDEADESPDHVATPNDELAVDGIKNERNVVIHGDVSSGEWEAIMMECHKDVKVWNVGAISTPSLETLQFQVQAVQDVMKALADATQIYVLPEEPGLSQFAEERADQAMRDPERAVVVGRPTTPERSRLLTQIADSGAVVVASLEDAALYVACAV
ncbi:hypothetical protein D3C81_226230 [compost metagenome]